MRCSNVLSFHSTARKFTILEEKSPAKIIEEKKERFLLSRLREEEKQRKKQMDREADMLKKKREAR